MEAKRTLPLRVHVMVYNGPANNYVGLDVFATFDAALRQFDHLLRKTIQDFGRGWIVELVREVSGQELYFRDRSGYEIFCRRELIQN